VGRKESKRRNRKNNNQEGPRRNGKGDGVVATLVDYSVQGDDFLNDSPYEDYDAEIESLDSPDYENLCLEYAHRIEDILSKKGFTGLEVDINPIPHKSGNYWVVIRRTDGVPISPNQEIELRNLVADDFYCLDGSESSRNTPHEEFRKDGIAFRITGTKPNGIAGEEQTPKTR